MVNDVDLVCVVVVMEFIYVVLLYYDDVMDEVFRCCGVFLVNLWWGNLVVIMVGDYLFLKVFLVVVELGVDFVKL